jgi:putative PIN family toxin of toxin-antitoxin system
MKAKHIVLDSNVLISAALSPNGMAAKVVNHVIKHHMIVFCDETFDELQTRLWRPKFDRYITLEQRKLILHDLGAVAEWVEIQDSTRYSRDIDDDKFIATALAGNAEIIVSGDSDLLVLEIIDGVRILNPADFHKEFVAT